MLKSKSIVALTLSLFALIACSGMPPLVAKSAAVPSGVELTGQWQMIGDATADMLEPMSDDILVDVFLVKGKALKITQTEHALFVSFDRAVVEEFRFGENRVVNVGPVEADRVSGWQDGAYLIETRDADGAMLSERYMLNEDGSQLTRAIVISKRNRTEYEQRQVYEKE